MEVSKLHNLTYDINRYEGDNSFVKELNLLYSSFNQLRSNPNNQVRTTYNNARKEVIEKLRLSAINNITPSYKKILEDIGGNKYVGDEFANAIESALKIEDFNIANASQNLKKLIDDRNKFFNTIRSLNLNLGELGVSFHFWGYEKYELGILVPKNITNHHRVPDVTKHLNKWNKILKDINEITGQGADDINISFQDVGTLHYFFDCPEITVTVIVTCIERVSALYKKILEIRKLRAELKKYDFPKSDQSNIEKHESSIIEKEINEITEGIFKNQAKKKFEGGRRNELKNALRLHLKWIAKQIDNGEVVEVNPPELSKPKKKEDESEAQHKKEIEKIEKKQKQIDLLVKRLNIANEVTKGANEVFKYLKSGEDEQKVN